MSKTITVKGIGKASAAADFVVVSMVLESQSMQYEKAMNQAAEKIDQLNTALETAGFEKKAVKTTNFDVETDYKTLRKTDGSSHRVFNGYVVTHNLKVEFDFDSKRLSQALSAIGSCLAKPQLSINFTVKDAASLNEEMLRSAAVNARRKADILCNAAGEKLGELLCIDYSWDEINFCSKTRYRMGDACLAAPTEACIDIEPDDVDVSDTVTFIWAIQ